MPNENQRRLEIPLFSGAGGVPGRWEWEWRGYPLAEQRRTEVLTSCAAPLASMALLESQIHKMGRKCSQMKVWQWKSVRQCERYGRWSLKRFFKPRFLQGIHGEILGEEVNVKGCNQFSFFPFPFEHPCSSHTENHLSVLCRTLLTLWLYCYLFIAPERFWVKKGHRF